jgi:4-hydroxythreonine-4-phosphate dehydrogenase
MLRHPRLLITMGDVAGVGPEIIARAWPRLVEFCRPIVVGDSAWLASAVRLVESKALVRALRTPDETEPSLDLLPCVPATDQDLSTVQPGQVSGAAGRAAYDFLCAAIDYTMSGWADGIVTAPLHKEGLHAGGLRYPGHTEILAERTGTRRFAMMLYHQGLGVIHVTLHMALRDVFEHLTREAIVEKAQLLHEVLFRLHCKVPRIAIAALNPHASDGGLFGNEEATIIEPAVTTARLKGINVSGPLPSDTLFVRARDGAFDGVVAMYHDQGHIALKMLGGFHTVNISAGLPIVRTSVAHGTAYDIAGKGIADATSLIAAARVAARLAQAKNDLEGVPGHEDHSVPHSSRSDGRKPGSAARAAGTTPRPAAHAAGNSPG